MHAKKTRRDLHKEAAWRELMNQWKTSGGSVRDFCKKKGLKETGFHYWRRELRKRDGKGVAQKKKEVKAAPSFAAVEVAAPFLPSPERLFENEVEISFSNGTRLRFRAGLAAETVGNLIRTLGPYPC